MTERRGEIEREMEKRKRETQGDTGVVRFDFAGSEQRVRERGFRRWSQ